MRQIIFDTETTGLEPSEGHRVIEIGAVELNDRKYTGNNYHQFLNPDREIEKEAIEVHGIKNEYLKDMPRFADIVEDFMKYMEGAEVIIHNAPFDVGFINNELMLCSSHWRRLDIHCQILDTLTLAKSLHPGQRNSLDALCKRYAVDNTNRTFHGALLDSELLGDVYLLMTGGQGQLFGDVSAEAKAQSAQQEEAGVIQAAGALKVIRASEDELTLHVNKVRSIKDQSGINLWEE